MTPNYRQQFQDQGYLVVKYVFDAEYVKELYQACEKIFADWRQNSTIEGEPKGMGYSPDAWILTHLNHSKYHRDGRASLLRILNAVGNPMAMQILKELFQEDPLFAQANYYFDPPGQTRIAGWHRDSQFFAANDEAAERESVLSEADPPRELHMHIPLVPSCASELVPGSHKRWDTAEENHVRRHDPTTDAMPGRLKLELEPGDLAFFHVNALHRGTYLHGVPRRTIAVSFSRESMTRKPTAEGMKAWQGYVCTYQPWALETGYLDGVSDSARELFERFVRIYGDSWNPEFAAPEVIGAQRHKYFFPDPA